MTLHITSHHIVSYHITCQDENQKVVTKKIRYKTFSPELSGDLWGVICYHHWYPRAGLEGPEKSVFSSCRMRFKMMQNYPLSIFHPSVPPESSP